MFLLSCTSKSTSHFDKSFEEEYPDGTLKRECKFIGLINKTNYRHHCKLYHQNGNLAQEGDFINDTLATGWHIYYRANGTLKAKREYFQLSSNMIYLNQVIRFEANGDTDKDASNYYSMYFDKDTIAEGEDLSTHFKLDAPYFKNSYITITLVAERGANEILASDGTLSSDQQIHASARKGEYQLKGFIDEIENKGRVGDTIKVLKRPLYFNKTYWVK
ncbi:MAG: hypothetical protein ABI723_10875 [Bacteroidia bacterium]